ncbi:hypothetical protein ElyMa_002614900 [Elysia marginata]|uniref:Uncharacterized protein n=1 Tax=Elysia marginata TaxID=1093978 RepID=A0AAV4H314_9GAST|nr:hypothetical protein ElyMa_002614900 [Elysia marginata]
MTGVNDRNLYGSERESRQQALQLAKKLQSSTVLGAGEYNYTYDKLRDDVWQSSCNRDFPVCLTYRLLSLIIFSLYHHHYEDHQYYFHYNHHRDRL